MCLIVMARLFLLNHPDSEPEYSKRKMGSVNILPWNTRNVHWRKFIQRTGEYLHNGIPLSADLCFWAEYEPYSKATIISKTTPKAIHTDLQPVHVLPPRPQHALNTDPYIYGCFRNICCRRTAKYKKGDILIFGTFKTDTIFEFDTVIVVEKLITCYLLSTDDQYRLASIDPLQDPPSDFIDGVVYTPQVQYYSFVPCLPNCTENAAAHNYHKPVLDTNALFGRAAKQGWYGKVFAHVTLKDDKTKQYYWLQILKAVKSAGLKQGISVDKIDNEQLF